jgi:hypothetical protein
MSNTSHGQLTLGFYVALSTLMVDATISRVRMRDLARPGCFRPAHWGLASARPRNVCRACASRSGQLTPRSRRPRGINHQARKTCIGSVASCTPPSAVTSHVSCMYRQSSPFSAIACGCIEKTMFS